MDEVSVTPMVLAALFGGAFLDATLGFCFFVFGEAFFLMAGGLLALGHWSPVAAVLSGAWLADQTGYGLGALSRRRFRRFALAKRQRRAHLRRAVRLLERHGAKAVIASRLLGPVAWIMPALVGSIGMTWKRFALASAAGVLIGVGMFVGIGFASAKAATHGGLDLVALLSDHKWTLLIVGQGVFLAAALISRFMSRRWLGRS